jgi:hypothetical protein
MKDTNILENVPALRFWGEGAVGWYCLAGAVTRYLEYVGDPVPYAEVMGVSGAAWRLIWNPGQWSPDNLIMGWYGHLLAEKRIAEAFGYQYAFLDRMWETPRTEANSKEAVTARICAEIDSGRPAIAIGIAGPEECMVAGYRDTGKTLLVQSFFERPEHGDRYLEVSNWYEKPEFLGLHVFTKTGERKSKRQNLIEALQWAVKMASLTEAGGRAAGLAAYDTWAQDMLREEDFAGVETGAADLQVLQYRRMSIGDNGIILLCARQVAAEYLEMMQGEVGEQARARLLAAAGHLRRESKTMGAAHDQMPWGNIGGEELIKRFERTNRELLASVIRECKACFVQAMTEIKLALQAEGV